MTIVYREAAEADVPALLEAMREVLAETGAQKAGLAADVWAWQYRRGPLGAIVVLALDGERICGYYHVLLVPVRLHGTVVPAGMVQDVAVMAPYRGRGIFRGLGGHALELMAQRGVKFAYTFPNRRSEPSFLRDHAYGHVATITVWVRPLSLARLAAQRIARSGAAAVARAAPAAGSGAAPEEMATVAAAFCARTAAHLERSAAYLRWRFFDKPGGGYVAWGSRSTHGLDAYVVTRRAVLFGVASTVVMDLGCADGRDAELVALVRAVCDAERGAGMAAAILMAWHPVASRLSRAGFVRVPGAANPRPLRLLARAVGPSGAAPPAAPRWTITAADWDVL